MSGRIYAYVVNGLIHEIIQPFFDNEGIYVPIEERFMAEFVAMMHEVTDLNPMPLAGWTATEVGGVWTYAPYVAPPPTPEEVLASQSLKLQQAIQLAAAQKTALTERISQINDAIDFGDATPAEEEELPVRTSQLTAWKRYATLLGRVTAQSGWYETVVWPVQPAEGMDLTVSAVAKTVQAS